MEVKSSTLIFHNYHKKVASYVELTQPFMFLYEHINSRSNLFSLIEFSDLGYYTVQTSYDDFIHLGNQPLHTHDFYEITYVLSGNLHMQIEDHTYIFLPATVVSAIKIFDMQRKMIPTVNFY